MRIVIFNLKFQHMSRQTGIWIDLRNAYIIHLPDAGQEDGEVQFSHLTSHMEEEEAVGAIDSAKSTGPNAGDMRSASQERRKLEEKDFFESVIKRLRPVTSHLVVFGPSEAKHGLVNAIEALKDYRPESVTVKSADQMSENQMVAWVREFFDRPAARRLPPQ